MHKLFKIIVLVAFIATLLVAGNFLAPKAHADAMCRGQKIVDQIGEGNVHGGYTLYLCWDYQTQKNFGEVEVGSANSQPLTGTLAIANDAGDYASIGCSSTHAICDTAKIQGPYNTDQARFSTSSFGLGDSVTGWW